MNPASHVVLESTQMLWNYFIVTVRNLRKHFGTTLITVLGLAAAMGAALMISRYLAFELSYDKFHRHAPDLYRLTNDRYQNGELIQHGVITYPSVIKALKEDYPEVVNAVRVVSATPVNVSRGDVGFEEDRLVFADSAFFSMFTFPLISGDARSALGEPYEVVISERLAAKYFGQDWRTAGILGQVLTIDRGFDLHVSGVMEDVPPKSHMHFDLVASYATLGPQFGAEYEDSWTNSNFMGYVQLAAGTDAEHFESKLLDFSDRHFNGNEISGSVEQFHLQPLTDIHLHSDFEYEDWTHGSATTVWAMLAVGAFILIIAWVNYVNLSTARALDRAREVAVRKIMGSDRRRLVKQFLLEAVVVNVAAFGLAMLAADMVQPAFSEVFGITFASPSADSAGFAFIVLFTVGTILSGLYPALAISSFRPAVVLKGQFSRSAQGNRIRKGLVAVQFGLSFALIAGTFVVYSQIRFMMEKDLGANLDHVVTINGPRLAQFDSTYFAEVETFKQELTRLPGVVRASATFRPPGRRTGRLFDVFRVDGPADVHYTCSWIGVDHDYFAMLEIPIIAGRSLESRDHNLDFNSVQNVVINNSALSMLGYESPDAAVGTWLHMMNREWKVVGVVADYHQESLKVGTEPTVFLPLYSPGQTFLAKVSPRNLDKTLSEIGGLYERFFAGNVFEYRFLDDYFNRQYVNDRRFRDLFGLFAGFGIVLACMGLFGLSSLTAVQRRKEIGIRKVVGASVANILNLLVSDYTKLISVATFAAVPLTYFTLSRWLQGYAYHIDLTVPLFLIPAVVVLTVAVTTVAYESLRAAIADPVVSLRHD